MKCVGGACGHAQAARDGSCKAICLFFYISGGGFHIGCLQNIPTGSLEKCCELLDWEESFKIHLSILGVDAVQYDYDAPAMT